MSFLGTKKIPKSCLRNPWAQFSCQQTPSDSEERARCHNYFEKFNAKKKEESEAGSRNEGKVVSDTDS
jgi:hypothetical protein